jgi:hypothetical protein
MNSVTTLPKVDDQDADHHEEGDAETEFLADEVAQALAGDRAHAGAHFLHHDQRERDRDHGPKKKMSKLCPGLGVDQDAAGIVIDVRGNKTRADYGEKEQDPGFRASEKLHGHFSLTYGWSSLPRPTTPQDKRM